MTHEVRFVMEIQKGARNYKLAAGLLPDEGGDHLRAVVWDDVVRYRPGDPGYRVRRWPYGPDGALPTLTFRLSDGRQVLANGLLGGWQLQAASSHA